MDGNNEVFDMLTTMYLAFTRVISAFVDFLAKAFA